MCGIAGLIHKGKSSNVGGEMTAMLQALKHRGPDSTGYAVYGESKEMIIALKSMVRMSAYSFQGGFVELLRIFFSYLNLFF